MGCLRWPAASLPRTCMEGGRKGREKKRKSAPPPSLPPSTYASTEEGGGRARPRHLTEEEEEEEEEEDSVISCKKRGKRRWHTISSSTTTAAFLLSSKTIPTGRSLEERKTKIFFDNPPTFLLLPILSEREESVSNRRCYNISPQKRNNFRGGEQASVHTAEREAPKNTLAKRRELRTGHLSRRRNKSTNKLKV